MAFPLVQKTAPKFREGKCHFRSRKKRRRAHLEAEAKKRMSLGGQGREKIPYPEQAGKAAEHAAAMVGANPPSPTRRSSPQAAALAHRCRRGIVAPWQH
jgi:hypothetical protein